MTDAWGWPQWTWFALALIRVIVNIVRNGEPLKGVYNGVGALFMTGLIAFVLYEGGFFP